MSKPTASQLREQFKKVKKTDGKATKANRNQKVKSDFNRFMRHAANQSSLVNSPKVSTEDALDWSIVNWMALDSVAANTGDTYAYANLIMLCYTMDSIAVMTNRSALAALSAKAFDALGKIHTTSDMKATLRPVVRLLDEADAILKTVGVDAIAVATQHAKFTENLILAHTIKSAKSWTSFGDLVLGKSLKTIAEKCGIDEAKVKEEALTIARLLIRCYNDTDMTQFAYNEMSTVSAIRTKRAWFKEHWAGLGKLVTYCIESSQVYVRDYGLNESGVVYKAKVAA